MEKNTEGLNFKSKLSDFKRSAFGDLIDSHNKQIIIVSKTYENELVVLSKKIAKCNSILDEAEEIIGKLEADKENLEELLNKYKEKETKKEVSKEETKKKDAGKKPKQKIPQ